MAAQLATTNQIPSFFSLRAVGDNVLRNTLLWLGLGMVVGVLSSPSDQGIVRIIAGAVAGMITFPFLGAFLGLFGGQWRATLAGGISGLMLGFGLGVIAGVPELLEAANVGLIGGALVGATFVSYLALLRKGLSVLSR